MMVSVKKMLCCGFQREQVVLEVVMMLVKRMSISEVYMMVFLAVENLTSKDMSE